MVSPPTGYPTTATPSCSRGRFPNCSASMSCLQGGANSLSGGGNLLSGGGNSLSGGGTLLSGGGEFAVGCEKLAVRRGNSPARGYTSRRFSDETSRGICKYCEKVCIAPELGVVDREHGDVALGAGG
eukprot:9499846-Pyramimonas_sp.AAC.1